MRKVKLPKSCTSLPINLLGVMCFLVSLYVTYDSHFSYFHRAVLSMVSYAVPVVILEVVFLKTYKKVTTGLDFTLKKRIQFDDILAKVVGFYFSLAFVGLLYFMFIEYHRDFYEQYHILLRTYLPYLVVLAIPYIVVVDKFSIENKDGYWHFGNIFLGNMQLVSNKRIVQHMLSWLVKMFFLPLMFVALFRNVQAIDTFDYSSIFDNYLSLFDFLFIIIFTIDVGVVSVGYIFSLKIFDSHIRSTEYTLLGWVVALECYQPFWSFTSQNYFGYEDSINWTTVLANDSILFVVYGAIIVFLFCIYIYATIAFGLRFSNLTHRGIITNGPYAFTKHPAYVSKNIAWWLISIPFVSESSVSDAIRHCVLLGIVNIIYWLRAKTEERHLSKDPVYVEYAIKMNKKSVFRWVNKIAPFLRYNPDLNSQIEIKQFISM